MTEVKEIDGEIHYIVSKKEHQVMKRFLNGMVLHKHKTYPFHNNAVFNHFWKDIQESEL